MDKRDRIIARVEEGKGSVGEKFKGGKMRFWIAGRIWGGEEVYKVVSIWNFDQASKKACGEFQN